MVIQEMSPILELLERTRSPEDPNVDALHAGLTLILAEAAAENLRAGEPERAARCVEEAERCLAYLV